MPIVQFSILKGRTQKQKAALAEQTTQALVDALGAKREAVRILINEVEHEHWFRGGTPIEKPEN